MRSKRPKRPKLKVSYSPSQRDLKKWKRELISMWHDWMPKRSSVIWTLLGISVVMNLLFYLIELPLKLHQHSLTMLQLWTPLTTGWVEPLSSPLFILLLLGFVAAMKSGVLSGRMTRPRYFGYALCVFMGLLAINLFIPGLIWSLVAEGLILIWFGAAVERRIGSREMLILAVSVLTLSYLAGAAYLSVFGGIPASGLKPFSRGLIIAWGYIGGQTHLQILNIRAYQLRWVVYAFIGFELLLYPAPIGLINLVGAGCIDLWAQRKLMTTNTY